MAQRMVLVVDDDEHVGLKRSFPDAVAAIVDAARVAGPGKRHVVVKHAARVAGSLTQFRSSDVAAAAGEVLIRHGCEVRIVGNVPRGIAPRGRGCFDGFAQRAETLC